MSTSPMKLDKKFANISFTTECACCKEKFIVSAVNLKKKEFETNNQQSIFLTYYDCPHCEHRMFVQVDNVITQKVLVDISCQLAQLSIAKNKGKKVSRKQLDKFKKTREDLVKYRIHLMKEFSGKLIYDEETDKFFELRFKEI